MLRSTAAALPLLLATLACQQGSARTVDHHESAVPSPNTPSGSSAVNAPSSATTTAVGWGAGGLSAPISIYFRRGGLPPNGFRGFEKKDFTDRRPHSGYPTT